MDHLKPGAFLVEFVMHDQLVIPVPPDPEKAGTPEDLEFAEDQRQRWDGNKWDSDRQDTLLYILGVVAVPVEWNHQRHEEWAAEYEKSKAELPAMAAGAVAVSPYESLDDLKEDLGISEQSSHAERLQAARGMPGNLVSAVVGREFLVPEDPGRDGFYLLQEAVDLV